jgi:hypothetical protein
MLMSEINHVRFRDEAGKVHSAERVDFRVVSDNIRIALLTNVDDTGEDGRVLEKFLLTTDSE